MTTVVKLAKLTLSPINVRKRPDELLEIPQMAADIEARGVLQNLLVTPVKKPRGTFEVFDGGRRLRGLRLLAERGVIDAAEWVGPVQDRRLGLHKAAKNYYNTGWHEPSTTTELMISKKAFNALPKDIQGIVRHVAAAANIIAHTSAEALNGDALEDLVNNHGVKVSELPTDVIEELRKKTAEVLEAGAAANPMTRKVHDSFMSFKKKHDKWANSSNRQFAIRVRGG